MLKPQFILPLAAELVVDLFAGGGGASTGIEMAIGRHVDIAVNHDPAAVSMHEANHPQTRHFVSDVFEVDPVTVTGGQPVGLLWASPDCKHFSKAKGGKPVSKKIRSLAWVVVEWARAVRPRVICLENVEEFQTWGPLTSDDLPDPARRGETFREWKGQLEALGYVVEHRELKACDFGAPTIRKRLFLVARCDGEAINWPTPTHGPKGSGLKPYRTAAECIDWSIPCPSIFERDKPLAEPTQRRIAHGIRRYVLEAAKPFIMPVTHPGDVRVHSIDEPLRTVTGANRGELALTAPTIARIGQTGHGDGGKSRRADEPLSTVTSKAEHLLTAPTLVQTGYGERPGQAPRAPGLDKPLGTCVDGQKHAVVAAFLAKHFGGEPQAGKTAASLTSPAPTVLAQGGPQALVTSHLTHFYTSNTHGGEGALTKPLKTVTAGGWHAAEVRAFLLKYYGEGSQDQHLTDPLHTIPTHDRFGLVTVEGEEYFIADIGMRMLQPRELYRAQGFPESYVIDRGADGRELSKKDQVRMCGNSVVPPLARVIVAANFVDASMLAEAA